MRTLELNADVTEGRDWPTRLPATPTHINSREHNKAGSIDMARSTDMLDTQARNTRRQEEGSSHRQAGNTHRAPDYIGDWVPLKFATRSACRRSA